MQLTLGSELESYFASALKR